MSIYISSLDRIFLKRFVLKVDGITHQVKSPVKNADQDLHRATAHRQYVLGQKQPLRQGHISQQAAGKCQSRETQPDDCQILEVPAIGLIAKRGQQISISVEVRATYAWLGFSCILRRPVSEDKIVCLYIELTI